MKKIVLLWLASIFLLWLASILLMSALVTPAHSVSPGIFTGLTSAASGLPPGTFIIGDTGTALLNNGISANYLVARKFTASVSGNMVTFKLTATTSCNVKVGVYTDTGTLPGTLLNSTGSVAVVGGAGGNSISIASTTLASGTNYWLVANSSATCLASSSGTAGTSRYVPATFSNAIPSTWPGGSASSSWQLEYSGFS